MGISCLSQQLNSIEKTLSLVYDFSLRARSQNHLVSREMLKKALGEKIINMPEWRSRAAIWLLCESKNELSVGLHIDEEIVTKLQSENPYERLTSSNLDAFCVVIEELSHFHLILNRALRGQGVSKVELEWQGEVDKLLLCAMQLQEQVGDPHTKQLVYSLSERVQWQPGLRNASYLAANKYAVRFVRSLGLMGNEVSNHVRLLQSQLRRIYNQPWSEKLSIIG